MIPEANAVLLEEPGNHCVQASAPLAVIYEQKAIKEATKFSH